MLQQIKLAPVLLHASLPVLQAVRAAAPPHAGVNQAVRLVGDGRRRRSRSRPERSAVWGGGEVGSGRWGAKGGGSHAGLGRGRRIRRHRALPRLLLDVEEERGGAATPISRCCATEEGRWARRKGDRKGEELQLVWRKGKKRVEAEEIGRAHV